MTKTDIAIQETIDAVKTVLRDADSRMADIVKELAGVDQEGENIHYANYVRWAIRRAKEEFMDALIR